MAQQLAEQVVVVASKVVQNYFAHRRCFDLSLLDCLHLAACSLSRRWLLGFACLCWPLHLEERLWQWPLEVEALVY